MTADRLRLAAILGVYALVFCVLLPYGLWRVAAGLDGVLPGPMAPTALGAVPAAWGLHLQLGGMWALWRRGHGWPVTALPPPLLVTGGPFRVARHPIYLGFNAVLLGVGLMVGSPGLAFVVAPLFLPVWCGYALVEERGLRRRFGREYARYARQVGLLPRPSLRPVLVLLAALRVLRVRVRGGEHIPAEGPVVLVGNHTCYADPVWLALSTPRRVWMAATAEAYRGGVVGWATRWWPAFPVRRYRPDPSSARQLLDRLAAGEVVGLFNERERSVLGAYLGTDPAVAGILPKLGVPVVPVGIQGAYATGPRWAGTMRFPTLELVVGPPIDWSAGPPEAVLDGAIRALLAEDPQRVWLEREPLHHLHRAVWRCPACLAAEGWVPERLSCEACGARWVPSGDGRVQRVGGEVQTFAAWARPVWDHPEPLPWEVPVRVARERDPYGPIEPLIDEGEAVLRIDADGLHWEGHHLPAAAIRSTSTERADTLQIGTADAMWQFRAHRHSPFRMRNAVDAVRGPAPAVRVPPVRPVVVPEPWGLPVQLPTAGASVGVGVAVTEGLVMLLPLAAGEGAAGLGDLLLMTLLYAGAGLGVDLVLSALGVPALGVGAVVLLGFAALAVPTQLPPLAVALLGLAGLWALAAHHPRWRWLALPVALWGLSPILPRPTPPRPPLAETVPQGPSFALVVLDSVRSDRTTLGRDDRDTTPHLAALAARGTRFDRAYSPSCWSLPAHASMLTGQLPSRHGAHYEHLHLDASVPTVVEALREAGWATAAFSGNALVAPGTGLGQGFTGFRERWRRTQTREAMVGWRAWHRFVAPSRDKGGAQVIADLEGWLAVRDPERPFFVLVNLFEAHAPHQEVPHALRAPFVGGDAVQAEIDGERLHMAQVFGGTPALDRERVGDLADGAVAAADAYLGRVLEALGDDVVVMVVSDHGESFGEHEGLWGHNLGLYEPLVHVPFVVAGPGVTQGTVEAPVSLVDLAPTLRGLAGLPPAPTDGVDLGPVLGGGPADPGRVVHAEHFRTDYLTEAIQIAHPFADHAFLRARRAAAIGATAKRQRIGDGRDLGFDLGTDPGETAPFPGERTGLPLALPEVP